MDGRPGVASEPEQVGEAVASEPFVYPHHPDDGWEPGEPSLRAMAPSTIAGGLIPISVYFLVRHWVGSDAPALAIAGIPAALWVGVEWVRRRTLDPIGAIVLFGFLGGIAVSAAMGGNALALKVRESAFTGVFGLVCLASLRFGSRPLMFFIGRSLSAGEDPERIELFNQLWEMPPARVVFWIITAAWGVGLIAEAAVRVILALALPTGVFVAVQPVVAAVFLGGLFAFTVWFSRWARAQTQTAMAADFPEGGGTPLWWARFFADRWLASRRPPSVPGARGHR